MRNIRLEKLIEREKELNCIYAVEEVLRKNDRNLEDVLQEIIGIIPSGYQYSTVCEVRIKYKNETLTSADFRETEWLQSSDIVVDENIEGSIDVAYTQLIRLHGDSAFLPQEQKLLNTIAGLLSDYIFYKDLQNTIEFLRSSETKNTKAKSILKEESDEHWKWRLKMSELIAEKMDFEQFDVKGVYICGSTKEATAGPESDIDLIVHQRGDETKQELLKKWIDGWGLCLSELNYSRTGHKVERSLIDLHIISDEDFKKKTSFASMIGACYNSARPLKIKEN